jgi:hypothetical protein
LIDGFSKFDEVSSGFGVGKGVFEGFEFGGVFFFARSVREGCYVFAAGDG